MPTEIIFINPPQDTAKVLDWKTNSDKVALIEDHKLHLDAVSMLCTVGALINDTMDSGKLVYSFWGLLPAVAWGGGGQAMAHSQTASSKLALDLGPPMCLPNSRQCSGVHFLMYLEMSLETVMRLHLLGNMPVDEVTAAWSSWTSF